MNIGPLGPMDWTIIAFGVVMLGAHGYFFIRGNRHSLEFNRHWQSRLAGLLYLFPMLGILGTVSGLQNTLAYIAREGAADMSAVTHEFSTALSTTMEGVLFALICALLNFLLAVKLDRGQ
jgi:uncharacterized membrane protein